MKAQQCGSLPILIDRKLDLRAVSGKKARSGAKAKAEARIFERLCGFEGADGARETREGHERFPVAIARGNHLFPYRTQKLSL